MLCVDNDFDLYGDYNSENASVFQFYFEKCSGRSDCKDDTEITDFLRRKFLFSLQNENIF